MSCRDADMVPKVPDAGEIRPGQDVMVQVMHEGTLVVAGGYHGDWMAEIIERLRGHHEPQEELVFHRIVERIAQHASPHGSVVIELGAFWSYYAMWAMRALHSRAVLVEPDPNSLEVGRRNLALNRLTDAVFINAAVGGADGETVRLVCESDGVARDVTYVTVPRLLAEHAPDGVDLLLVDTQGQELDVITRAADLLAAGLVRFIVVSTHHHSISGSAVTHQDCLSLLEGLGAHIIAEHTVGESFSGDGLIAASFRAEDRDLHVPLSYARYKDSLFGELEPELAAALARLG